MIQNIKKSIFVIGLLLSSLGAFSQSFADCNDGLSPICGSSGITFTASTGVTAASITNPGNNYSCLGSSPNPTWYYLEVSQSGSLDFSLSAPFDIDFIIYGPFSSTAAALAGCESYGTGGAGGGVVDCSYSSTASETPSIPSAVLGQVYVLLITNYASTVQNVTFNQTGGTGLTDCNILVPDPCVSDPGTYTLEKNNSLTSGSIYLCEGDSFEANSNGDYILPNDTLAITFW
jgi:hypothetical protein